MLLSLFNPVLTYVKYYRSKEYVTASCDGRSTRTPNILTADLLAIHLTSVVSPQSASSAINHMQRGNAKNPLARFQNASTAPDPTRPVLPTVHINNSTSYVYGNRACRSRQHVLFSSRKLTFQLSSRRRLHTGRIKHGLKLHLNL